MKNSLAKEVFLMYCHLHTQIQQSSVQRQQLYSSLSITKFQSAGFHNNCLDTTPNDSYCEVKCRRLKSRKIVKGIPSDIEETVTHSLFIVSYTLDLLRELEFAEGREETYRPNFSRASPGGDIFRTASYSHISCVRY